MTNIRVVNILALDIIVIDEIQYKDIWNYNSELNGLKSCKFNFLFLHKVILYYSGTILVNMPLYYVIIVTCSCFYLLKQ